MNSFLKFTFSRKGGATATRFEAPRSSRFSTATMAAVLFAATAATAYGQQSPWGTALQKIAEEFTGPIARAIVLIGIVVGGFTLIFSEGGSRRTIGNLVFGGSLCLGAAQFVTWLFT